MKHSSRTGPGALALAALSTLLAACPARPAPAPRSPAPRASPAPPLRVLRDFEVQQGFVQLLGVDRQRREAHALVRFFGHWRTRPPVRLVTVPLDPSRSSTTWVLPAPASALIDQGILYEIKSAQGSPWLKRLLALIRHMGPWYVSRLPPILDVSPRGDWVVYADTADKRALASPRGGAAQLLNGASPACYRTTFSPDGRWLAYSCFSRIHKEYCPTLRAVAASPGGPPAQPRQACTPRGYAASGPYWRPDSGAFFVLARRGFGAYLDPVKRICLLRVEVPSRRSTPLWCQPLHPKRDRYRTFRFRPAPDGKTGVLLLQHPARQRCQTTALWLRLTDGHVLATWQGLPANLELGPSTALGVDGRLLVPGCDQGVLSVDLRTGRAARALDGRRITALDWDGAHHLVALEQVLGRGYRLLDADLRRLPWVPVTTIKRGPGEKAGLTPSSFRGRAGSPW